MRFNFVSIQTILTETSPRTSHPAGQRIVRNTGEMLVGTAIQMSCSAQSELAGWIEAQAIYRVCSMSLRKAEWFQVAISACRLAVELPFQGATLENH